FRRVLFRSRGTRVVDHAADDVGAEGAVVRADGQADAVPAPGQGRDLDRGDQARAGPGAADGDGGLAADVLLAVDGEGVFVDAACRAARRQPGGKRRPGLAHCDADL